MNIEYGDSNHGVYHKNSGLWGKWAISYTTGTKKVWRKLFGYGEYFKTFEDMINFYSSFKFLYDNENILNNFYSDESMLKSLTIKNKIKLNTYYYKGDKPRKCIDRSNWVFDENLLNDEYYFCCNFKRPYINGKDEIIENFLKK